MTLACPECWAEFPDGEGFEEGQDCPECKAEIAAMQAAAGVDLGAAPFGELLVGTLTTIAELDRRAGFVFDEAVEARD